MLTSAECCHCLFVISQVTQATFSNLSETFSLKQSFTNSFRSRVLSLLQNFVREASSSSVRDAILLGFVRLVIHPYR